MKNRCGKCGALLSKETKKCLACSIHVDRHWGSDIPTIDGLAISPDIAEEVEILKQKKIRDKRNSASRNQDPKDSGIKIIKDYPYIESTPET